MIQHSVYVEAPEGPFIIPGLTSTPVIFSLVIPTFNEAANIKPLIERLEGLLRPLLGRRFELIVVDDDSEDETWRIAAELAEVYPSVRVIRRQNERGLATAVLRGWQVSRGEVLGVIDADLQHPPEALAALLAEIGRGADLAAGSRNAEGGGVSDWSFARRVLSRGAQLLGLIVLPEVLSRLTDPMSGMFLVRRAAVEGVPLDPIGYKILIEVVARGKVHWIGEAAYVFREREEGKSKVSLRVYVEYLLHLVRLRLKISTRFPILRYATVGLFASLLDMGLLYVLSEEELLGWGIARSKLLGGLIALALSFPLHEFWTFRRNALLRTRTQAVRRLLAFVAVATVGLFAATLALSLLVEFSGLDRYSANAVGIVLVGLWNYFLHRQITWTNSDLRVILRPGRGPEPTLSSETMETLIRLNMPQQ
jgi:dolichol-phosphate mannosyltransferase